MIIIVDVVNDSILVVGVIILAIVDDVDNDDDDVDNDDDDVNVDDDDIFAGADVVVVDVDDEDDEFVDMGTDFVVAVVVADVVVVAVVVADVVVVAVVVALTVVDVTVEVVVVDVDVVALASKFNQLKIHTRKFKICPNKIFPITFNEIDLQ